MCVRLSMQTYTKHLSLLTSTHEIAIKIGMVGGGDFYTIIRYGPPIRAVMTLIHLVDMFMLYPCKAKGEEQTQISNNVHDVGEFLFFFYFGFVECGRSEPCVPMCHEEDIRKKKLPSQPPSCAEFSTIVHLINVTRCAHGLGGDSLLCVAWNFLLKLPSHCQEFGC